MGTLGTRLYAFFIAVFSALGAFLFGLDIGYIAPILECASFKRDVAHLLDWQDPSSRIPDVTVGFIVGIFSIGSISTSFPTVSGYFLDTWGRKASIMIGTLVFLLGCIVQVAAFSVTMIMLGRLVAGMSIGLLSSVVSLYQSELAPPSIRGALTSLYQLMITFGILVAALADHVLVEREGGWRMAIGLQLVPAVSLLAAMPLLPRSPRWLVQMGRREEALQALQTVREEKEAQVELQEIIESHNRALALGEAHWPEFFEGRVGRLLLLGVTLQLLQQLVGMNAFMYFGPRMFADLGLNVNTVQTLTNAVNFVATFPALFIVDRCGRRVLLICSALGMTLACVVLGTLGHFFVAPQPNGSWTSSSELASMGIIAMVFFFIMNFAYGWGPIVWVYNSEIYPLKYRSRCVATTACANWVGNYMIAQFTPILLGNFGFGTFYIFALFTSSALLLALWLPETKGVMLEHVDEIFDKKFGKPEAKDAKPSVPPVSYGASTMESNDDLEGLVDGL